MTLYGYARVSSIEQAANFSLETQKKQLMEHGVPAENIFSDVITGRTFERPQLEALLKQLSEGDTLVVVRLDRLGRRAWSMLEFINSLRKRGIKFVSLDLPFLIDNDEFALVFFSLCAQFSELEYKIREERQRLGIQRAKEAGRYKGRKPLINGTTKKEIRKLLRDGHSKTKIADYLKISRSSVYNALKEIENEQNSTVHSP